MGTAIEVRTDYSSKELRRRAGRVKNAGQARRLLAIASVLDGASREEAAKIGGMDRQTLRDWVDPVQQEGPEGLVNKSALGAPGKLGKKHTAFLARLVEEGPIPAVHGVVRWRACDLIMRLHEEFGLSVSDDTVYRTLKELGFSHVSARPRAGGEIHNEFLSGYFRGVIFRIRALAKKNNNLILPPSIQRIHVGAKSSLSKAEFHVNSEVRTHGQFLVFYGYEMPKTVVSFFLKATR